MSEDMLRGQRDWLLVSEQFLTHQGEGTSTGQLAYFIRLGACNLHCRGCDTPYTWVFDDRHVAMHDSGVQYDPRKELKRIKLTELVKTIWAQPARLVVVTGGEPLLQAEQVSRLISTINEEIVPHRFEIETAGTVSPRELDAYENVRFNVSPKLASSGNSHEERYVKGVLREFLELDSVFKFVIDWDGKSFDEDLREVERVVSSLDIPDHLVWLMPCGTLRDEVVAGMKRLAPVAIEHGWNLSGRDHVLIYENKRGH